MDRRRGVHALSSTATTAYGPLPREQSEGSDLWVECKRGSRDGWDHSFLQRLLGSGGAGRHGAYGGVSC